MSERLSAVLLPLVVFISCLCALYAVFLRPAYFSNSDGLATLFFLEVLIAAIWNYRARFFPLLLAAFLWAGMDLPLNEAWTTGRWVVLAVGALAGVIVYARNHRFSF